ncbi:MAG: hypothetical protein Tsb0020_09300 [Haliangiales bacterium]
MLARAAEAENLPDSIGKAADQLAPKLTLVRELLRDNAEIIAVSPALLREADRDIDASWAALSDLTKAFARLPLAAHESLVDDAETVREALFYDGLRFLQRKFREQWVESQTRLDMIEKRELEPVIERLGGSVILSAIRETHQRYGDALGITAESVARGPAAVNDALRALRDSMRRYVLQVAAHVDPDDPATDILAEALLEPIAAWQDATRSDSASGDTPSDSAPSDGLPGELSASGPASGAVPSDALGSGSGNNGSPSVNI